MLKIIPKGKVPQHFKKRAVAGRLPDVFNISRTDTLLAGCHPFSGGDFLPGKVRL